MTITEISPADKKSIRKALEKEGINLDYFDESEIKILKLGIMIGMKGKGLEIMNMVEVGK